MVLFKRKPIEFLKPPKLPSNFTPSTPVWFIKETGEWFLSYEDYLSRISFYNIKKFVCETSGNSNFTYFEALKVEQSELEMMEENFPDPVKEPILRHVSFSTLPRIDMLVDQVYSKFKDDFFPGDIVIVKYPGGYREKGVVKEKATFNAMSKPDGSIKPGYVSYRVLLNNGEEVFIEDQNKIGRERNSFTKWYVKTFLKMSLTRSNRLGAPWVVKDDIAKKYRISLEWPKELKRFENGDDFELDEELFKERKKLYSNGNVKNVFNDLKETPPTDDNKLKEWMEKWYETLKKTYVFFEGVEPDRARDKVVKLFKFAGVTILKEFDPNLTNFIVTLRNYSSRERYDIDDPFSYVHPKKMKVWHYEKCQRFFKSIKISNRRIDQLEKLDSQSDQKFPIINDNAQNNSKNNISNETMKNGNLYVNIAPAPNSKLLLPLSSSSEFTNSVNNSRSITPIVKGRNKKDLKDERDKDNKNEKTNVDKEHDSVKESSVEIKPEVKPKPQPIIDDLLLPMKSDLAKPNWKRLNDFESPSDVLEVWIFINMFHKALLIDTFTFDDFLTALRWEDSEKQCGLLLEIYCCLMSAFMNNEGELLISLPLEIENDNEEEIKDEEKTNEKFIEIKDEKLELANGNTTPTTENREVSNENGNINDKKEKESKKERDMHNEMEVDEKEEENGKEEEEDDEDDDDINHNAYSILDYKKISWKERLKTKQFKDGQWLIILFGICSISEYIPSFKPMITNLYETLAPLDESATPQTLTSNFMKNFTPNQRIQSLTLLMSLLLNGSIIRSYLDNVVEQSASLRRERLELVKELKIKIENAHSANKDVLDSLRKIDTKEIKQRIENLELANVESIEARELLIEQRKRGGRPVQNTLPPEPSDLEKAVCASYPDFMKLVKIRTDKVKEIEDMKNHKLELERGLVELNCQRVRFIGKDRVWNRYWWFEKNGLPNLGGGSGDDDDDDVDGEENGDSDDKIANDNEDNEKYLSETYLMGRLWIQGPNDSDRLNWLDSDGMKRKLLEENDEVLKTSSDWKYIDQVDDIEKLITWLNEKGTREKQLKKELIELKDQIYSSLNSRKKFLTSSKKSEEQEELENIITKGCVTEEDYDEVKSIEKAIENGEDEEDGEVETHSVNEEDDYKDNDDEHDIEQGQEPDQEPETELEDAEDERPRTRTRRAAAFAASDKKHKLEDEEPKRRSSKRIKQASKTSDRVSKRMLLKRKLNEIAQKKENVSNAQEQLEYLINHKETDNVLQWVNSSAIEKLGFTHYEGPKMQAPRGGSRKKSTIKGRKKVKGRK